MQLKPEQVKKLKEAIDSYNYPAELWDFENNIPISFENMRELEIHIQSDLISNDKDLVRLALANVVYWGFASTALAPVRSKRFLEKLKDKSLEHAMNLFSDISGNSLIAIKKLGLPQFSQMSFTSKLRMFLDPHNYVVLDFQLLKLKDAKTKTLFQKIKKYPTSIPITRPNCEQYNKWSNICKMTALEHFSKTKVIAVDIERGIFNLVNQNRIEEAAMLVASMTQSNCKSIFN